MRHWLMKSEPDCYGWDHLVAKGEDMWEGVRNHAASKNLSEMSPGDEVLFYHSRQCLEAVGIMEVSSEPFRDPTSDDGKWWTVKVKPKRKLKAPVSLKAMKEEPRLKDFVMLRQGRLSVVPVSDAEWKVILEMAGE